MKPWTVDEAVVAVNSHLWSREDKRCLRCGLRPNMALRCCDPALVDTDEMQEQRRTQLKALWRKPLRRDSQGRFVPR